MGEKNTKERNRHKESKLSVRKKKKGTQSYGERVSAWSEEENARNGFKDLRAIGCRLRGCWVETKLNKTGGGGGLKRREKFVGENLTRGSGWRRELNSE